MIQVTNLGKSYGLQELFSQVNFQLGAGERVALVGRNGHGKSTLFRIILGEESASTGEIVFPKNYKVGHLQQHLILKAPTVLEEGVLGLPEDERDDHHKVEKILFGLGFTEADMQRPPSDFSGGFQIRIHLAKVLLSQSNLLLLDEPTNYLDILSMRWLTRFLQTQRKEMIIISHDRGFLDQVCTHTMGIHRQRIKKLPGGTDQYFKQLMDEEILYEKTRLNEEKKIREMEGFIERFRSKASKASVVQSRVKALAKREVFLQLAHIHHLDFEFPYAPCPGQVLLKLSEGTFAYKPVTEDQNQVQAQKNLFSNLDLNIMAKDRIGIIGKNGKGKSTLLKVLAGELNLLGGKVSTHPQTKINYFGQTNIDRLNSQSTIEEEVRSVAPDLSYAQIRGICATMMFEKDLAQKKISVLSGGERSRVLVAKILASPCNLLLLDEPNNHLDMESVEALVEALEDFPGGAMMVTHNEMVLKQFATKLIIFKQNEVIYFPGGYEEFLEKGGWEEEKEKEKEKDLTSSESTLPKVRSADHRYRRSEMIKERSKVLGPLKQKIDKLEKGIMEAEDEIKGLQEMIIAEKDGKKIGSYQKSLKLAENLIEQNFEELEVVSAELKNKEELYEKKLNEI